MLTRTQSIFLRLLAYPPAEFDYSFRLKGQDLMVREHRWLALVMSVAVLTGCVTSPVYTLHVPKADQPTCTYPMKPGDTLIGIAISGGGSRAALFGAAGLEALAKLQIAPAQSLLEDVSMISSVSGGSMATSYFASVKPKREVPILTASGELSGEYQAFFAQYKVTMNQDYERPLLWRNLLRLRWFNPAWTAKSLSEYLNSQFLKDMNFQN